MLLLFPHIASAQVVWEDYQGQNGIGTDTAGPNYNNNSGNSTTNLNSLRSISANVANATRTGTASVIDFRASSTLCDINTDPTESGQACQTDAQGRVLYARLKFPQAGTYSFSVAHDDEVDIDMSSNWSSTSYRTIAYDIPVASLSSYTTDETTYETLGTTFSAPSANSCVIMRVYWNNAGGYNDLRMRWTRPDGVTETIPATALLDPSSAGTGCAGAVTTSATSITVNKIIGTSGRAAAADQFTVSVRSGTTVLSAATTSGSGTGQQVSTGGTVVTAGTYTINDAMASGSTSPLSAYTATIACTRGGTAVTTSGTAPNWTVTISAGQQITCNITNTRSVIPVADTGTGVSGTASTPIANVRANDTIAGAAATSTNSTIATSGTWPTGFALNTTTGAVTMTSTVAPGTYSLSYTLCDKNTPANCQTVTDTVTVSGTADLAITKTDGVTSISSGASTTYTVTVTNNGPSVVTGAILSDPAVTGLNVTAVACAPTPGQCVTAPTVAQLQSGTFALPALTATQTYSIRVTGTITATSGTVANVATVTAPSLVTDSTTANNTATDSNTVQILTDLMIKKTNTPGVNNNVDQANDTVTTGTTTTYTLVVTNNGTVAITGTVVKDTPVSGLTCAAANPVTITGNGVPAGSFTVSDLVGAGITLGTLGVGQSATLTYSCSVN